MSPTTALADRFGVVAGRPRFCGVRLEGTDAVSTWGTCSAVGNGEYEHAGIAPRSGDRVIDIGANVGVFALWASHLGAASVECYEPGPDAFACLRANTRSRTSIRIHQAAVVGSLPADRSVNLYLHGQRSTRNSLLNHEIGSGEALDRHVSVVAVGINDVLSDGCDLLKVDCEGSEFDLFSGITDESLHRVHRLVLEFHRTAGAPESLLGRLESAGFDARIAENRGAFGTICANR